MASSFSSAARARESRWCSPRATTCSDRMLSQIAGHQHHTTTPKWQIQRSRRSAARAAARLLVSTNSPQLGTVVDITSASYTLNPERETHRGRLGVGRQLLHDSQQVLDGRLLPRSRRVAPLHARDLQAGGGGALGDSERIVALGSWYTRRSACESPSSRDLTRSGCQVHHAITTSSGPPTAWLSKSWLLRYAHLLIQRHESLQRCTR